MKRKNKWRAVIVLMGIVFLPTYLVQVGVIQCLCDINSDCSPCPPDPYTWVSLPWAIKYLAEYPLSNSVVIIRNGLIISLMIAASLAYFITISVSYIHKRIGKISKIK